MTLNMTLKVCTSKDTKKKMKTTQRIGEIFKSHIWKSKQIRLTRHTHLNAYLKTKTKLTSVDEDTEKLESSYISGKNVK